MLPEYGSSSLSPLSSTTSSSSIPSPQFAAFANPMHIPLKSRLSPPSTTSSASSLSPAAPVVPICSPSASCAYPSWPNRDVLSSASTSPDASPYGSRCNGASSYISDEDLLDLAELDLYENSRIPTGVTCGISWGATKQPPIVLQSPPLQMIKAPEKRRRRSSPLKRRRPVREMSVIAEGLE